MIQQKIDDSKSTASKVHLYEKNEEVGGRLNSEYLVCNGEKYRFDTGPSLLLLPDIYRETFQSLGAKSVDDIPEFLPVNPFYRVYFEADNSQLDISTNAEAMKHSLEGRNTSIFNMKYIV